MSGEKPREQEPTEEQRDAARTWLAYQGRFHKVPYLGIDVDSLSSLLASREHEAWKAGMRRAAEIARSVDLSAQFRMDISPRILVAEAIEREASRG